MEKRGTVRRFSDRIFLSSTEPRPILSVGHNRIHFGENVYGAPLVQELAAVKVEKNLAKRQKCIDGKNQIQIKIYQHLEIHLYKIKNFREFFK